MLNVVDVQDKNLYDLIRSYEEIYEDPEWDGEVTEEMAEIERYLEAKIEGKFESIGALLRNWKLEEEAYESQLKRLRKRKAALSNRQERLKEWALDCMNEAGVKEAGKLKIQLAPPALSITDPFQIPEEYSVVSVAHDRPKLKKALKEGPVAGAELIRRPFIRNYT